MRRILLAVVLMLLICSIGYSMDIGAGPKGAIGYSTFLGSDWVDFMMDWKRGFFFGAGVGGFLTLGFSDPFAIELEAMWWRLGGADQESGTGKESFIANYISPAVLFKARFNKLSLLAGPMLLFKLGTGKYVWRPEGGSTVTTDFGENELAGILLAATTGIGYRFPSGPGSIVGELRGIYSLSRWFNQDLYTFNWRTMAVLMTVGYSFPVSGDSARR